MKRDRDKSGQALAVMNRQRLAASVFEHAHDGIVITDRHGNIIEVNRAFIQVTGYGAEEARGRNPRFLKSGRHSPAFYSELWSALQRDGVWRGEIWNRRKNGEAYIELLTLSAVIGTDGQVTHYVGAFTDITLLKENQQRLERMAHYDSLTQLPNRALLGDRLQLALATARRTGKLLAVCYLDLDGFKQVNDTHGHAVGDRLLVEVAARLRNAVRSGDTVARLGGDEFVLLLGELNDIEECQPALERIFAALGNPFSLGVDLASISASIGVTLYPLDDGNPDTLMRHADHAMYVAKQQGRNRFQMFDAEHALRIHTHHEMLGRITEALVAGEFRMYYQPRVDLALGTAIGAEALIRWQHPERGLLSPAEFLPIVEGSPIAIAIGKWVFEEVLRQMATWRRLGFDWSVSINVSGHHLRQTGFHEHLAVLLAENNVDATRVELEILETTVIDDCASVSATMTACTELGVSFSLDDFGTGYSSLTHLRQLPASLLKIDRSFVSNMLHDPADSAIVEGVVGLAKAFRRDVVAEGVETTAHGIRLIEIGCLMAQGYGIARPMPPEDMPGWMTSYRPNAEWQRAVRQVPPRRGH